MIERLEEKIELCCNECGVSAGRVFDRGDFDIMIQHAKDEGWRVFKVGRDWHHNCADCRDDQ